MAFFKIEIMGRGASTYTSTITKEQFEFWSDIKTRSDEGEDDAEAIFELLHYGDQELDERVPEEARFGWENYREFGDMIQLEWAAYQAQCEIHITEVDSDSYGAKETKEIMVIKGDSIFDDEDLCETLYSDQDETYPMAIPGYIFYVHESERGTFFEGRVEDQTFDKSKLKFYVDDIDGNQYITAVEYAGVDVDNDGGDTSGKGQWFHFYHNEE